MSDVLADSLDDTTPPLSQTQRLANTFVAPRRTFADIRRSQSWWLPFLVVVLVGYGYTYAVAHRLGATGLVDSVLRSNPAKYEQFKDLPAAQQAAQRAVIGKITTISMFSFPLIQLLFTAFFALLLWVGFNFMLGGESTYPQMFAVGIYASLPYLVRSVLGTVAVFITDPDTFNLQDPLATNPGWFLPSTASPVLHALLGSLDVFTLWTLFLYALGGAIVARVKPSSGYALVFGAWLLFVAVKAGVTAAFS